MPNPKTDIHFGVPRIKLTCTIRQLLQIGWSFSFYFPAVRVMLACGRHIASLRNDSIIQFRHYGIFIGISLATLQC